jgi:hypothetical protein
MTEEQRYEILHFVEGRVFDVESYERTATLQAVFGERDAGYYVVVSEAMPVEPGIARCQVIGPFADLGCARTAAGER